MEKKNIRRVFVFFIVFLPLQYAMVGIVGVIKSEPWPAAVLPAFKTVYNRGDTITLDELKMSARDLKKDSLVEVEPAELFEGLPNSQLQGFLKKHFSDSSYIASFNKETTVWLRMRLHQQYPSLKADTLNIEWRKKLFNIAEEKLHADSMRIISQFSLSLPRE